MSFIVHSIPGSPFGRAVLAALLEKQAPFRLAPVSPGDLKGPTHLARHAFGRVPALEHDDGFVLYETQAILRHIDRVLPHPALTPGDARAAARMDQVMNISDWYLFQGVGNRIGWQRVVAPVVLGLPPDEAVCKAAMPQAHTVMAELSRLLGEQRWFAGDSFSLAELLVVPQLDILAQAPEWAELIDGRENVEALRRRAVERACFQGTTWEKVAALAAA